MSRVAYTYGRRGRLNSANSGIRETAPTYGTSRNSSFSEKAGGHFKVELNNERLVAHLLIIDPRVKAFQPQPFTVDLIEQRMLFTRDAVRQAWHKHRDIPGPKFYTPDFSVDWTDGLHHAIEVKGEGNEGDDVYWDKIALARPILAANGYPLRSVVVPKNGRHPLRMNPGVLKQAIHRLDAWLTDELVARVTSRCESGPISVGALCADIHLLPGLIPVLLVGGVISADIAHHTICSTLEVSLAYGDLSHLYLLEEMENALGVTA
jgi:hypothetical protein